MPKKEIRFQDKAVPVLNKLRETLAKMRDTKIASTNALTECVVDLDKILKEAGVEPVNPGGKAAWGVQTQAR